MTESVINEAAGKMHMGSCIGWYLDGHEACSNCMIAMKCKDETISKQAEKGKSEIAKKNTDPIEYLDENMKFLDCEKGEVAENNGVKMHRYLKAGKLWLGVMVAPSGKVKAQNARGSLVFEKFDTASVDEILQKLC